MDRNHRDEFAVNLSKQPGLREIAREEFWIVAKSFFAPIYGTLIVWRRLLRLTREADRCAVSRESVAEDPVLTPAE
jgi:hypothetical protein